MASSISRNYDVFLSFRGGDTCRNFTDHLYTTLTASGIQTFRDDEELEKGGDIASDLLRAIEESRFFIIIFSKNYAYSRWCLNEFVKIIERKSQKESVVLPIFYHVDPSDVRNQRGSFGDALAYHERDANQEKKEMIQKWRIALRQAANLCGCHVDDQYETEVVKEIVNTIIRRLNHQPLIVGKNIVGIANVRICMECRWDRTLRRKCCFKGSDMNEVPIIENPLELGSLCLRDCKNLTSLPSCIFGFKSLATLSCSGCSQLESFPEILQDMESLRKLYLDGTAIKEIPSSIQRLRGLQYLLLRNCKSLVNLPESICNLTSFKILIVESCPNFKKLPDNLGRLQSLLRLSVGHLDSMNFPLPSLSGLCSLRTLKLQGCNLREFPSEIYYLSSLVTLFLGGNHFSRIPDGISQLYNLKYLDLSHCKMLQHIPELPSGLWSLDAHHCTYLENLSSQSNLLWSSLFKCFKSQIQGREFRRSVGNYIAASNKIPEWIRHQKSGFEITMKLPWSWYENDDFLGFVLCSLYVPLEIETKTHRRFNCKLNFDDDSAYFFHQSHQFCEFCYREDASSRGCLIYYPKSRIPKRYHSNECRTLKASFNVYFGVKPVKVARCGFQFLYAQDYEQNNLTIVQRRSKL